MKIEFFVELNITNIEFHVCFAMVAGADVAFMNKNCHVKLDIKKIIFYTIFFFFQVELLSSLQIIFLKIKWNLISIMLSSTTTKLRSKRLCERRVLVDATFVR